MLAPSATRTAVTWALLLARPVAARSYHSAYLGAEACDSTTISASEESCLAAVRDLLPAEVEQGRIELVVVTWDESPTGCSMQSGGDWAAVYNRAKAGKNDGSYSPVCVGAGRRAGKCQLPRESDLSAKRFEAEYLQRKPVIITGGAAAWLDGSLEWSKDAFVERYGSLPAPLRDPELLPQRGSQAPLIGAPGPLSDYAAAMAQGEEPIPLFEANWEGPLIRAVRSDLDPRALPAVARLRGGPILSLGGEGTGVSWHRHPQSWLSQLKGVKRWFLRSPEDERPSFRYDPCSIQEYPPSGDPIQSCDAQPGDILYLPDSWWHATCNLGVWTLSVGGQRDVGGLPAAHLAALDGDEEALRAVADRDGLAALSATAGRESQTPAHVAALVGGVATLGLLKDLGADLAVEVEQLSTPLLVAAQWGHLEVLRWFDEHQHDVTLPDRSFENTALHRAARWGHSEVVEWLLRRPGATAFPRDGRNQTPLHLASFAGHAEVVQLLVQERGGEEAKQQRDRRGLTPLDLSIQAGEPEVARLLGAQFLPGIDDRLQPRTQGEGELQEGAVEREADMRHAEKEARGDEL